MMLLALVFCLLAAASHADDTKVFYATGWNAERVRQAEQALTRHRGRWTVFLDADLPMDTGEFEDVFHLRMKYRRDCRALWCRSPVAMEVGLSQKPTVAYQAASTHDAWACTHLAEATDPTKGFFCMNSNQPLMSLPARCYGHEGSCQALGMFYDCSICFDARVRYFCLEEDRACTFNLFQGPIP